MLAGYIPLVVSLSRFEIAGFRTGCHATGASISARPFLSRVLDSVDLLPTPSYWQAFEEGWPGTCSRGVDQSRSRQRMAVPSNTAMCEHRCRPMGNPAEGARREYDALGRW